MGARSYRIRIPLSLIAVSLITALAFSLAVAYQTYLNVRADNIREGRRLAHAMLPVLRLALKHDDIWQAYAILRDPRERRASDTWRDRRRFILVDSREVIFASNQPRRYPVGEPLRTVAPEYRDLPRDPDGAFSGVLGDWYLIATPILSEDQAVGTLLLALPKMAYWDRFIEILRGGAAVMLIVLLLVLPFGWLWGRRIAAPLARLSDCMARIGRQAIADLECSIDTGDDEIGRLSQRFREMLAGLKEKEALERQMVAQERLAAVGRVAAGVAHEINNPLAGLLVAIDTYRHTPARQRNGERTLNFIERGLRQIQETMQALLVESRLETRALQPCDIDDVQRLVRAEPGARERDIEWRNGLSAAVPIAAGSVRQILLNLALNAVQATARGGCVEVDIALRDGGLHIEVGDDGGGIDQSRLERLFEPFSSGRPGGSGLGLWVTYQIVTQLRGEIEVASEARWARFTIRLPLKNGAEEGT